MFDAVPMREITNVVVEHETRKIGKSSYTIRKLVKLASFVLINHSMLLLRTVTITGIGIACLSLLTGILFVVKYFVNASAPAGWTSLAVLISLLSGFILTSLGVLGEYIGRLVRRTNSNTPYSVYREINL